MGFLSVMYKIVASDLDGTLLRLNCQVSPETKQILCDLTNKGVHFIFATGRHHKDVENIKNKMGIDAYMITSNGARIHAPNGELLFEENLDEDIVFDLLTIANMYPNIVTQVYRGDDWFSNEPVDDAAEFHPDSKIEYHLFDPSDFDLAHVAKVYYSAPEHEMLLPLENELNQRFGDRVNVCFSSPTYLEVMHGSVSKGHALSFVADQLNYTLDDCIAFGDGMNDVEMLSCVGKGCIMKNAAQSLKNKLPTLEVIGCNDEDAVAMYLKQLYAK